MSASDVFRNPSFEEVYGKVSLRELLKKPSFPTMLVLLGAAIVLS